jgi:outer membrane protein assembly factor BamB
MTLTSKRTYKAGDLTIWKQHIYDGSSIQLPMNAARTNPVVYGKAVFAIIFSQGRILAFHRETGKPLWKTNLGRLGGSHLEVAGGMLYAWASQSLHCIDPSDGRIVWSYAP